MNWKVSTRGTTEQNFTLLCSRDYLEITNEKNQVFGKYCGNKTGENVVVTGDLVRIIFHSDNDIQRRGYLLVFTQVSEGKWEHKEADNRVYNRVNMVRDRKRKCS